MSCSSPRWLLLGGGPGDICVVFDEADWQMLSGTRWHSHKMGPRQGGQFSAYARDRDGVWMHRLLMGNPAGMLVDHADGNVWNNRRYNLRVVTRAQNRRNIHNSHRNKRGCLKGVRESRLRFVAQIRKDGKNYYLGSFPTEEAAGRAYDAKALELFGEFAALNFPVSG